jgi:acetoin utilization deacetylase AcuC-like enzyme
MAKYAMLRDALAAHLPEIQLLQAPRASDSELLRVHTADYVRGIADGSVLSAVMREIGFPWSQAMAERARRSVGATVAAARSALRQGIGANLAGGTHHAYADKGGGFCVFNDVAVATRVLQAQHRRERGELQVAVIDLDVHQGNGTARIFQGDESVFTLSLHGEKNFPFRKEAGDLDVGLADGTGDADYLAALDAALLELDLRCKPQLVFFLAGADPHEGDRLGRLKLSFEGMQTRDQRVLDWCLERRIPLVLLMAGGYGMQIEATVQVQLNTYQLAYAHWQRWQISSPDTPL